MNFEDNLFYICLAGVIITWVIGLTLAKPYNKKNEDKMAQTQKILCLIYGLLFLVGAYGASLIFFDTWWSWVVIISFGMFGVGAIIEAFQKYPNAPKNYGQI